MDIEKNCAMETRITATVSELAEFFGVTEDHDLRYAPDDEFEFTVTEDEGVCVSDCNGDTPDGWELDPNGLRRFLGVEEKTEAEVRRAYRKAVEWDFPMRVGWRGSALVYARKFRGDLARAREAADGAMLRFELCDFGAALEMAREAASFEDFYSGCEFYGDQRPWNRFAEAMEKAHAETESKR